MESSPEDDGEKLKGDAAIIYRARKNFLYAKEWFDQSYAYWLEDTRFANADARNHDQWPSEVWNERDTSDQPCLTINKTRMHNNIIINESLQKKSSIKVRPTGGVATYEAAQAMQMLADRIENISKSDAIYEKCWRDQVDGGFGFVMLDTAYVNGRTRNQEIYLRKCKNPLCVYTDPDCSDPTGLDGNFGFEFESMRRETFNRKYPKFKNKVGHSALGFDDAFWFGDDGIIKAMYYERNERKDTLVSYMDPATNKWVEKLESELREDSGDEIFEALMQQIEDGKIKGDTREVTDPEVKWYDIAGDVIIDRGDWAGAYIPIIRCPGIEIIIDGKYDCKSHTRTMIDPQRMLNYNASASIEYGALQNMVPYIGPARAFEGQEQWKDANRKKYAYLQYNDVDEETAQPIEKPERQQPPAGAPVFMQGMQDAERQLMMVSGQYQAQMGENDQQSAASGKAINERQRQGDTATYHFAEHQADMLRALGTQIIDLVPKIYDTERLLHVFGEDGTKKIIQIAPDNKTAIGELKKEDEDAAIILFNPGIGEYDCIADSGPNYSTQRQEAWNAISIILQQNMQLAGTIGDLLFKFGDFPGSEEIMERLQKEIKATKPYLFSDDAEPQMVALQEQMKRLTALNAELVQKLAMKDLALKGKDEKRDIDASNAETNRLKVMIEFMTKTMLSPADQARMEHEIMKSTHDASLDMIVAANAADLKPQATGASEGAQ